MSCSPFVCPNALGRPLQFRDHRADPRMRGFSETGQVLYLAFQNHQQSFSQIFEHEPSDIVRAWKIACWLAVVGRHDDPQQSWRAGAARGMAGDRLEDFIVADPVPRAGKHRSNGRVKNARKLKIPGIDGVLPALSQCHYFVRAERLCAIVQQRGGISSVRIRSIGAREHNGQFPRPQRMMKTSCAQILFKQSGDSVEIRCC